MSVDKEVLARISKTAEDRIYDASVEATEALMSEVQRCLDEWAKRFQRHRFEAYQGHGMLRIRICPSVGEAWRRDMPETSYGHWQDITNIPRDLHRGAVRELVRDVEALSDAHVNMEWRAGTCDFGPLVPSHL